MNRFKRQLIRQIGFLANSCAAFDKGCWQEAIRIATCIRVLFHDTRHSTSLITHLNANDIELITSLPQLPDPPDGGSNYCSIIPCSMGVLSDGKQGVSYGPILDDFIQGSTHVLPFEKWWNQVFWSTTATNCLTRRQIVLAATNQDGGAHVDENLDEKYEDYSSTSHGKLIAEGKRFQNELPITDMHLVALRTIGNEVMKSPDFQALTK